MTVSIISCVCCPRLRCALCVFSIITTAASPSRRSQWRCRERHDVRVDALMPMTMTGWRRDGDRTRWPRTRSEGEAKTRNTPSATTANSSASVLLRLSTARRMRGRAVDVVTTIYTGRQRALERRELRLDRRRSSRERWRPSACTMDAAQRPHLRRRAPRWRGAILWPNLQAPRRRKESEIARRAACRAARFDAPRGEEHGSEATIVRLSIDHRMRPARSRAFTRRAVTCRATHRGARRRASTFAISGHRCARMVRTVRGASRSCALSRPQIRFGVDKKLAGHDDAVAVANALANLRLSWLSIRLHVGRRERLPPLARRYDDVRLPTSRSQLRLLARATAFSTRSVRSPMVANIARDETAQGSQVRCAP